MKNKKNPAAVELGRLGGSKSSDAKKRAAKLNIEKRWAKYRSEQRSKNKPKTK